MSHGAGTIHAPTWATSPSIASRPRRRRGSIPRSAATAACRRPWRREGRGGVHPARRRHHHRRPAGVQRRHRLRAHAPRHRRQARPRLRHRAASSRPTSGAGRTRPSTRRRTPTAASSSSGAPTRPAPTATSASSATRTTAASTPASAATASSRPTSPARSTRPTRSPCNRTARSSSPGSPPRRADQLPTTTSRSSATTATARSTRGSRGRQRHHRPRHDDGHRPCGRHPAATAASSSRARPTGTSRSCATPRPATSTPPSATTARAITDFGADDFANGIALTAGGQILVAGHTLGSGLNLDFALARYSADGALDESFGTRGIVKTDIGGGDDFAENLTVQPDGRIVVVGRATSPTILDMAVVRYRDDGTPRHGLRRGRRSSPPTSTARASSARTSPSSPTARSWRPATPPTASTRSSP